MKALSMLGLFLLLICSPAGELRATEVKSGGYIISLYDFDYSKNSYSADLWLWFVIDDSNSEITPIDTYEIVNSNFLTNLLDFRDITPNGIWQTRKVRGVFQEQWDLSNYPFDSHTLEIVVEEADLEVDEFRYSPDQVNSKISETLELPGWEIMGFEIRTEQYDYDTNFGNPSSDINTGSSYSRLILSIAIKRDAVSEFIKLHTVVFIAMLISTLSLMIAPTSGDYLAGRSGMIVAMIYAIVLNLQFVNQLIYSSSTLTLTDKLHFITLFFLLAYFLVTIMSYIFQKRGKPEHSRWIDLVALKTSLIVYPLIIFSIVNFV